MTTDSIERRWNDYLTAYGPISADERQSLLLGSVDDDVVFTNPGGEGRTRAGLIGHIENFQRNMPGTYFKTDKVFSHDGEFLAIWSMHKPDHTKAATGYNFVRVNDDGRFGYMAGFF
jgi:SnoaL-like protein